MCIGLLRLRIKPRSLELDEERLAAGEPEDTIRPRGVAQYLQLGADEPQMLPCEVNNLELNRVFSGRPHACRQLSSSMAWRAWLFASSNAL
jgi:hypothetical protein